MINLMQAKSLEDGRFWDCGYMFSHYFAPEISVESHNILLLYGRCGMDIVGRRVLERAIATWHLDFFYRRKK